MYTKHAVDMVQLFSQTPLRTSKIVTFATHNNTLENSNAWKKGALWRFMTVFSAFLTGRKHKFLAFSFLVRFPTLWAILMYSFVHGYEYASRWTLSEKNSH